MSILKTLKSRAAEPSSQAGLAVLLSLFGASDAATQAIVSLIGTVTNVAGAGPITAQGYIALAAAAAGTAAVVLKEKAKPDHSTPPA